MKTEKVKKFKIRKFKSGIKSWINIEKRYIESWNLTINLNKELRKNAKNDFKKDSFKLMNNAVFGKTMENVTNHRGIKLITTETRRNYLVLEPKYHTKKFVSDNLLATEIEKTPMIITKPVYSGLTILEISKIVLF